MKRACFSGSPACIGCNPCDACAAKIRELVLPKAMIAGGFNGVVDQARAFFAGYEAAWKLMHERMVFDPALRGQLHVVELPTFQPTLNAAQEPPPMPPQGMYPAVPMPPQPPQGMYPSPPIGYAPPAPLHPNPAVAAMMADPQYIRLAQQQEAMMRAMGFGPPGSIIEAEAEPVPAPVPVPEHIEQRTHLQERRDQEERSRMRAATTPVEVSGPELTAEEIAPAGQRADPTMTSGMIFTAALPGFGPTNGIASSSPADDAVPDEALPEEPPQQ